MSASQLFTATTLCSHKGQRNANHPGHTDMFDFLVNGREDKEKQQQEDTHTSVGLRKRWSSVCVCVFVRCHCVYA